MGAVWGGLELGCCSSPANIRGLALWMLWKQLGAASRIPASPLRHFLVFQPSPAPSAAAAAPGRSWAWPCCWCGRLGFVQGWGNRPWAEFRGKWGCFPHVGEMFWFTLTLNVFQPRPSVGSREEGAACSRVRMGQGSWKGELCSNVFIYFICPYPKGKQELLCVC